MAIKRIIVCVEREYENSKWCTQTLSGLCEIASSHKFKLDIRYDKVRISNNNDIAMVLGTTQAWLENAVTDLYSNKCRIILISNSPVDLERNVSRVIFDREESMHSVIKYAAMTERKDCALFGFNPDSPSDSKRYNLFLEKCNLFGINTCVDDLYLNNGNIDDCYNRIAKNINKYNFVICANDPVAIYLIRKSMQIGHKIPERFYVLGFGNSTLSELITPSLSTVSLDYTEIGRQAVNTYLYLLKHAEISSIDVFMPCKIEPRMSTGYKNVAFEDNVICKPKTNKQDLFFDDPQIREFFSLERFFEQCDEIDYEIIKGLRENVRHQSLAQKLHISEYTLKYRLKKIYYQTRTNNTKTLISLINKYSIKL